MRVRPQWCLLGLVVLIGACSGIGDLFKEPDIQLERAIVKDVGLAGGDLDLIVKVDNPNVEGQHLGDITYDDDFTVAENGTTTITLPLKFGWAGVGSAVRAALGYGDLPYKMEGQAELKTPWGRQVVPFTREGRVPLTRSGGTIAIPGQSQ